MICQSEFGVCLNMFSEGPRFVNQDLELFIKALGQYDLLRRVIGEITISVNMDLEALLLTKASRATIF